MIALDSIAEAAPEITEGFHEFPLDRLMEFQSEHDPNNLLGMRWLCKAMSCLWVGPAGIGKSSLLMQLAILWALGLDAFGIRPARPLRSLIVQAENVEGDVAEMLQGVVGGMNLHDDMQRIAEQVSVLHASSLVSSAFVSGLEKEIIKRKPDMVWIDPLLSYVGDDLAQQKVASAFLRNMIQPMLDRTGVLLHLMHHTGKPPKDAARKSGNEYDFVYQSFGSSELANWPRAINIIFPERDDTFLLKLQKRGKRAGAVDIDGISTTEVYIRHSETGICWKQCDKPEAEAGREGPKVKLEVFAEALKEFGGSCTNKNVEQLAERLGCAVRTVWNYWHSLKAVRAADKS